jgi:hypothetical protein
MSWLNSASENKVTSIVLQGESTIASDGSGNAYIAIPFDPSSSGYNFTEWSSVSTLYSEIKHVATQIQVTGLNITALTQGTPLFIGYIFSRNTSPTSLANVVQLSSTKSYNLERDTSSRGFTMTARARGPLNWSPTSTVVTNAYAGCPGSFQIAGNAYTVSINLALVRVKSIYLVRGRA